MRMQIAHTGKTGKDTSITFDTERKMFCHARKKYDVWIYAELVKDITYVIYDLKKLGYKEVLPEEFGE